MFNEDNRKLFTIVNNLRVGKVSSLEKEGSYKFLGALENVK